MRTQVLPIHFFTIVLNGNPFIKYHELMLKELDIPWKWHIVEGVASLVNDTAWSLSNGGSISDSLHQNGLSNDGTSQYIDELKVRYPNNIEIYRKPPGIFWDGKTEMVSAPLPNIQEECLLWQIDSDELWSPSQITRMHNAFSSFPDKSAAYYWCWYFVGPEKIISTRYCYAENPKQEWLRTWRYMPGDYWGSHEPPTLARKEKNINEAILIKNVANLNPFSHHDTERMDAVFQHYAYVTPEQIKFKEIYYGYSNAYDQWLKLQSTQSSNRLGKYLSWVSDDTFFDDTKHYPIAPIATLNKTTHSWLFSTATTTLNKDINPKESKKIAIDGIFWQYFKSGIGRVWKNLLEEWVNSGFIDNIIVLDREGTAPKIKGVHYWSIRSHSWENTAEDSLMLEETCALLNIDLFISTYYSTPIGTPSFFFGYDMIPEVLNLPMEHQTWQEKKIAILHASDHSMISNSSCQDLKKYYPSLSHRDIHTIHLGVDPSLYHPTSIELEIFLTKYNLTNRGYILFVGDRLGYCSYKNGVTAFTGLANLSSSEFVILCVGGGPNIESELVSLVPHLEVIHLSLEDEELRAAYAGAHCLLYVSKYEGFGLPLLEALKCRCPVVTCYNSSIPEVVGDAAIYVDQNNPMEIYNAIQELKSTSKRDELNVKAQEQSIKFSFFDSSKKLQEILLKATELKSNKVVNKEVWSLLKHLQLGNQKMASVEISPIKETPQVMHIYTNADLDHFPTVALLQEALQRTITYPLRLWKRLIQK